MDLERFLPYKPNLQQRLVIEALERFLSPQTPSDTAFILNGYAGTGKTSLTGALVKALNELKIPTVLLAPTGRAAKVFSQNASAPASTIHRRIYRGLTDPSAGISHLLRENPLENALFIVDEASMIPDRVDDQSPVPQDSLLDDLLQYVFSGTGCKLLLLGDTAQLPPVGAETSPALDPMTFKSRGINVSMATLTATARQARGSAILANATWQRQAMQLPELPRPVITPGPDVKQILPEDMADLLSRSYRDSGTDSSIIITRSNWRAANFNRAVRSQVLDADQELIADERLIVVKNNYTWAAKSPGKKLDFIANGDLATVNAIYGTEDMHGLRFADLELSFPHASATLNCKVLLDTLQSDTPSLEPELMQQLAQARMEQIALQYPSEPYESWLRRLRKDEYFTALQVKYAYAVTCHKAQGGQWNDVIIDMGGIDLDHPSLDFYRWLYTATTRATQRLYFLGMAED